MAGIFGLAGKAAASGPVAADRPRIASGGVWAFFCLGVIFGLATSVLSLREMAVAAAILAATTIAVIFLRRLADRSDERILAGDFSYRSFFDSAIEGIFRTTPNGHYLDVNPALARIYGYETPEELKRALTDISSQLYVDPRRRDDFKALMLEHDEVVDFVSEIRRRDGATIWISENARAIRDWRGRLICYQGTVEDVTAKFAAERAIKDGLKRAEEANRTKNTFLAMMSHELKTPLNAIIGFSEMIQQEMLGPMGNPAYQGYIENIHASGIKLTSIINDVLDVARLQGAAIELAFCECCADEIVEAALRRAQMLTSDRRDISILLPDEIPNLRVDKTRLAQVIGNLLANALKFTPKYGAVNLRVGQAPNGGICFEVRDQGIGMDEDTIAMVQEPFHQADASLARRFEGAGLGLPIAKALTELHGGTLNIVSGKGRGTTVTVDLPRSCLWTDVDEKADVVA